MPAKLLGMDETALDANTISSQMKTFSTCYKNLNEKLPKCHFEVAGHSIICFGLSYYEPSPELEIACHNPEEQDGEFSI